MVIPVFFRAILTRSPDSFTSAPSFPTITKQGRPEDKSTSTSTRRHSMPIMVPDKTVLNKQLPPDPDFLITLEKNDVLNQTLP